MCQFQGQFAKVETKVERMKEPFRWHLADGLGYSNLTEVDLISHYRNFIHLSN
jgi:hypothetical protein